MPHSLKSRIKSLCYKGEITEKERDKIIKALEEQSNRCDSCIHSDECDGSNCYECVKGMADNFEPQPCEDCISRKRVIMLIDEATEIYPYKIIGLPNTYSDYNQGWTDACNWLYANIESDNLPSVTPQAKDGRWIRCGNYDCVHYDTDYMEVNADEDSD
ncbi:MAG: hypothetical protein J6Y78_17830 [Paludibacteraceae bacterium]|nr:hypothetical protein [Paludibacteraceae bacterium]